MNQNIGISFTVRGADQVERAVREIGSSLEQLERKLDKISLSLNFTDKLNMAASATSKLATSLERASGTAGGLNNVAVAIERIAAASARVQNIASRITPQATPTGTPPTQHQPRQSGGYIYPTGGTSAIVPVSRGTLFSNPGLRPQIPIHHQRPEDVINLQQVGPGKYTLPNQLQPMAGVGGHVPPGMPPKGPKRGKGAEPESMSMGGQPLVFSRGFGLGSLARGYMAYQVASNAYQAARWQARDISGGEARKDILEANKGLIATDFSKADRDMAEARGADFTNRYPLYTQGSYLTALAESASSFSPNEVGMKNLFGLNETSLKLSTLTGTKDPQQSVRLITDILNAKLLRLPADQQKKAKSQDSTWISEESAKIAGQLNAAIRIFPAWGKDIQNFQAQGYGTFLERGWDLPEILSYFGVLKSTGFKSSTIGRSAKTMLSKEPRTMARLALLSAEDKKGRPLIPQHKLGKYKKYEQQLQQQYAQWMKDDPDAAFEEFYRLKNKAEKFYPDSLEAAGASRDFRSLISTELEPGIRYAQKEAAETIREEGMGGTRKIDQQLQNNIPDMVTGWQRLQQEMTKTEQALAKVSNGFSFFNSMANGFSEYTKALHGSILQKDRAKLLQDYPNPDENNKEYMAARAEYLKRGKMAGMNDQWLLNEAMATDPRNIIKGKQATTFDSPMTSYMGKAWDMLSGYTPLVDRYKINSVVDSAINGTPVIESKEPQVPIQEQQQNYLQNALEGKQAPIPGTGNAPLENSASKLDSAADKLFSAAHALQSINFLSKPYTDNNRFGLLQKD